MTIRGMLYGALAFVACGLDASQAAPIERLGGKQLDLSMEEFLRSIGPATTQISPDGEPTLDASGIGSLATRCRNLPSTQAIYTNVRKALSRHRLRPAYESVVPSKITIYTDAKIETGEAYFYYYSAAISSCGATGCDMQATALRIVAPVSDDDQTVLLSRAKWWNDHVSGDLIEAASPQALCRSS